MTSVVGHFDLGTPVILTPVILTPVILTSVERDEQRLSVPFLGVDNPDSPQTIDGTTDSAHAQPDGIRNQSV